MSMTTLRVTALATFAFWFAPVVPAQAQDITYHPDSAKIARAAEAGVGLIHWVQTVPHANEHVIYVRNISTRPIQVASYEIYDCVNLRGRVCGMHTPGPRVEPGKTVRLVIIDQGSSTMRASYHYRLQSAYADSTAADTSRH